MNKINKQSKRIKDDNRMTLLAIHKNKLKEFDDQRNNLSNYESELEKLKMKQRTIKDLDEIFEVKNEIQNLENLISNIKNKFDYSDYQLKSFEFVDEYKNAEDSLNKGQLSKTFIQECFTNTLNGGSNLTNEIKVLVCSDCNTDRIVDKKQAQAICPNCGGVVRYQDTDNFAEFSDEIEVIFPFAYRRINHFKERLSMLLARENSNPPLQDVIDLILMELVKNRITDKKLITKERIREYLQKNNLNKMYEHIPLLIHKISGTEPPKISKELENELIRKFEEIQAPFEKHKPPERKNFLSYNYCIYKFCQELGQDHVLENLSLLKSREKLHMMDKIYSKICAELGWKFIPSV